MRSKMAALRFWLMPAIITALVIFVFIEAGDGRYRYACQDPANFGTTQCELPVCLADQTCTDFLIQRKLDYVEEGQP